ncbi:MAG: hypothetical protein IKI93_03050 [Clostridia bacterium]|nr:hypothetical protein [Clostridia bacterium]
MKEKRNKKQSKITVIEPVDEEALFYSPKNIERLKRAAAALDAGEGVEHDMIEVDDDDTKNGTEDRYGAI